jgi:hypothetical protein
VTGFVPSTSDFPCQYHSASSSLILQEGQASETLKQNHALSFIGDYWIENHFHFPCSCCNNPNPVYAALIDTSNGFGRGIRQYSY